MLIFRIYVWRNNVLSNLYSDTSDKDYSFEQTQEISSCTCYSMDKNNDLIGTAGAHPFSGLINYLYCKVIWYDTELQTMQRTY